MAATIYTSHQDWHPGEVTMHRLMSAPDDPNPTSPYLVPSAAQKLLRAPILALGTLDAHDRPWTSIWGGPPGFARPMRVQAAEGGEQKTAFGLRCLVDGVEDPVLRALSEGSEKGGGEDAMAKGKSVSGLTIDLASRLRAKLAGTVVGVVADKHEDGGEGAKDVQMVVQVDSSLGNCPKYLNQKTFRAVVPSPTTIPIPSNTKSPPEELLSHIASTDCFFLTSSASGSSLSTNYRGGPRGFIRVLPPQTTIPESAIPPPPPPTESPAATPIRLIYPEYSGNRLYQTLGNLITTPRAGIAIPDFKTGTMLYATCTTHVLVGTAAAELLPRSNLAVVLTLTAFSLVRNSLGFRADEAAADETVGMSPYNPPVRYAAGEKAPAASTLLGGAEQGNGSGRVRATATIVGKEMLGPDVARVAFETDHPVSWKPGQHVALSFAGELDSGYSHMRDEDPRSLNDDWVRTFTVSSPAPDVGATGEGGSGSGGDSKEVKRFEVTVRNVGPCTAVLVGANPRAGVEVGVIGFGGEFMIVQDQNHKEDVVFIAGGVGVTPLLGQIGRIQEAGNKVKLLWAVRRGDLGFVEGVVKGWKGVDVRVFLGGAGSLSQADEDALKRLQGMDIIVTPKRLESSDMDNVEAKRWYICAGKALANVVEGWADKKGVEVIGESFAY